MGILDDAIRQHLELKRRQGAAEDELARLEGEAFGPPARPGDPDFPDPEAGGPNAEGLEPPALEADSELDQAADTGIDQAADTGIDQAADTGIVTTTPEVPASDALGAESDEGAEPGLFDQTGDFDLDLDDDPGEPEPLESQEIAEQPAVSSLDTVEHPAPAPETGEEEAAGAVGSAETELEPLPAGEEEVAPLEGEEEEEEELVEGEDVLEETPEFLRDQPEDDELWFEQGEPKDFDF